jgi:hypothetical protein
LPGLFVGCLIGSAVVWVALRPGAPVPDRGGEVAVDQTRDARAQEAEAARQAAESARAEAEKALAAVKQELATASKQAADTREQLGEILARQAEEQRKLEALNKALAEENKPAAAPARSFVRDWQLLGPFPATALAAHDTVYPPEREPVQLKKRYDGVGGQVKWQPYRSGADKLDLAGYFNYREAGAAFAVTWVFSDRDQDVTLGVGSDDGIRLWVNGAKVHEVKGGRPAHPGQDSVNARLKKGWNEILAKVDNIVGTWELYLEFQTADGGQPLKMLSTNTPPPAAAK